MKRCLLVLAGLMLLLAVVCLDTAGATSYWVVTPIGSVLPGTIRVAVDSYAPGHDNPPYCPGITCSTPQRTTILRVTPCPPGLSCTEGGYNAYFDGWAVAHAMLDLTCGVQYTFEGRCDDTYIYPDTFWGCMFQQFCYEHSIFVPVNYYSGATPVRSTTWGRVKVLYR
jgi:hypothetical protein